MKRDAAARDLWSVKRPYKILRIDRRGVIEKADPDDVVNWLLINHTTLSMVLKYIN